LGDEHEPRTAATSSFARSRPPASSRRRTRGRRLALIGAIALVASAIAATGSVADDPNIDPMEPITDRSDHYIPKAPGTKEKLRFFYGPYVIPPGWDSNRVDLDLPIAQGMVVSIEPGMRRVQDGSEPGHQEAHIHHAHWFSMEPDTEVDTYLGGHEWMFGNGDEETKANFQQRSDAERKGPIYGGYVGPTEPQPLIYMLHNKTSQPMTVYIMLEVTFIHGSLEQLNSLGGRPYHDVTGVLFGRTFDVPRDRKSKDGTFETVEDDPKGVIEWTSPIDGTLIGTGGHLHPGGIRVTAENYGSEERPCPDSGGGYGGTVLLKSDAIWRYDVPFSEDFQMEVTHPAFRAPIHEGDRIRISGTYENKKHAWYAAMTHQGFYIDESQPPKGRCDPYLVGPAAKRDINVTAGVPNRPWGHHKHDKICGKRFDAPRCNRPVEPTGEGMRTDTVTIANFLYYPGDFTLDGQMGAPPKVPKGDPLRFVNADQAANIRHSVTTCRWPCNGPYVGNYPLPDGIWDSDTLGYDPVDGGNPNPVATMSKDMKVGKYSYFCRIHPWMRGAFEVVKN
jgi:plastocyanin